MTPYPEAESGFVRWVFRVPPAQAEADRKVEVLVGRVALVDCNRAFFRGSLQHRTVQGWGYPYYAVEQISKRETTLMACPEGEARREEFVRAHGDGFLVRYNSKLPIVTYVPESFEVRYRIWTAGEELGRARPE
jgi:ecotin